MKKITLLLVLLVLAIATHSQRISDLTIQGITASAPFAAFTPTNNSETALGEGEMIVTNNVDLSNVNVSLNVGTDSYVVSPNPLPTNWSSKVLGIKVTKNDLSAWAKYNVTIKKINPAPLPLEIKTGTGNFNPTSWTPETLGWAGVCIEKNYTLIRLNSGKRSFMVAFDSAPDSLIYTIKYLTTPFPTDNSVIFDVDGSVDGVNWTSINQYNGTNPMPLSSPAVVAKLKINPEYRYVRWIYTKRASANVNIENILVTRGVLNVSSNTSSSAMTDCPDCDVVVSDGADLTVNDSKEFNSLTVRPGAKLTFQSGGSITGPITLESDANGTATLTDSNEEATINATVKQYVTAGRNWYMSAPLNSANTSVLNRGASVQQYNETTGLWEVASGTMTRGKGYIQVANSTQGSTGTVEFTGTTNSGNVPITLTNNSGGGKGFNLVGNPYPSYLSWSAVVADNAAANMPTGTMWYRTINYNGKSAWAPSTVYNIDDVVYNGTAFYKVTQAGTSALSGSGPIATVGATENIEDGSVRWSYQGSVYIFATVNAAGTATPSTVSNLIPPMQAFWVRSNGGTLTFKNSMRQHESISNKLKAPASNNALPFVRLSVSNGASADEAVIYASENASNTFDAYDAPKYFNSTGSNQAQIYTSAGTEKVAINALNSIEEGTALSLGFVTETANSFGIKATEVNNTDLRVILRDNQNANEFDLTNGDSYVFSTTSAVNNANRFTLIFRTSSGTTSLNESSTNNTRISAHQEQIQLTTYAQLSADASLTVFNSLGQMMGRYPVNSSSFTSPDRLTSGVYLVAFTNNQQTTVQRVIIP
jgi:hypothetical protein